MANTTLAEDIRDEIQALIEVFRPEFVREIQALVGQGQVHEAKTDAEKIAAFEWLARGMAPWQLVQNPATGEMMPNPQEGMFWTLALPYMEGIEGLLESGEEILRKYMAAKQRQTENIAEEAGYG